MDLCNEDVVISTASLRGKQCVGVIGGPATFKQPADRIPTNSEPPGNCFPGDTSLPPLGNGKLWCSTICSPVKKKVDDPITAIMKVKRSSTCSTFDWNLIRMVKIGAQTLIESGVCASGYPIAEAFLFVRQYASSADPDSEVGLALRPVETSLAEAVGKKAHRMVVVHGWLNDLGPRNEYLRNCKEQFGPGIMTPTLRSRLLLTYHKLYGSDADTNEAEFHSKSYAKFLKKGYKRPGREKPRRSQLATVLEDDELFEPSHPFEEVAAAAAAAAVAPAAAAAAAAAVVAAVAAVGATAAAAAAAAALAV
jgi:hypothetical protein